MAPAREAIMGQRPHHSLGCASHENQGKPMKMKSDDRYQWLERWMAQGGARQFADVLDSDLVCAYADATGATCTTGLVGAPRCPQLGRDLSAMYAAGRLHRQPVGLPAGDASMGFPKWVYSYCLKVDGDQAKLTAVTNHE